LGAVTERKVLPQWAPRVPPWKIRRLYETDAQGIYDDELIDDVGYGLLARCESFLAANEAFRGRAPCPVCGQTVPHGSDKQEYLYCDGCGWELSWGDYFATIQHKQLVGAEPVFEQFGRFLERFPQAQSARERMLLIDDLIHGFHWDLKRENTTRPVAVKLIDARLGEVIGFLDALTYGDASTPGMADRRETWLEQSASARLWAVVREPSPEDWNGPTKQRKG